MQPQPSLSCQEDVLGKSHWEMMERMSLEHPYRYMAALAGPLHACACMQDLGFWFEAYIFLFLLGLSHRLLFQKPSPVTQAAGRDVERPHNSSSPGHRKGAWPLGSAPFALGQREPSTLVRGPAAPGRPPLQQGCVPPSLHPGQRLAGGSGCW